MIGDSANPKASANPAFAMLGLPRLRLPSKPWLAFWAVVGTLGGGIAYDKWQQRVLREQYMVWGRERGAATMGVNEMPRKVRVYVAPYPNDYLAEAMKYVKRFVKPVLNASGVDLEVVTMERQGDIRFKVAEEIRAIRREKLGLSEEVKTEPAAEPALEPASGPLSQTPHSPVFTSIQTAPAEPAEPTVSRHDLYTPMDVVSVKSLFGYPKALSYRDATEDVRNGGGVICVGRGAFKEYVNGVHEGLLGPLERPETGEKPSEGGSVEGEGAEATVAKDKTEKPEEDSADYAPAPYIYYGDYAAAELPAELPLHDLNACRDANGVGYFFVQPVLELRNFSVAGFTRQLERLRRFYFKREQLVLYNESLKRVVEREWTPLENVDLGTEEEEDWPSGWRKDALKKNSEWVREFGADPRVLALMSTYNAPASAAAPAAPAAPESAKNI